MRILVLGAGGTGGYFGGRLLEAGSDVTFLVRPARAARLRAEGLVIRSPFGDARLAAPVVEPSSLAPDYDLVLLSCKAYDLDDAMRTIAPAMRRPGVTLLPLLNGLRHFEALDAAFGAPQVLGGLGVASSHRGQPTCCFRVARHQGHPGPIPIGPHSTQLRRRGPITILRRRLHFISPCRAASRHAD